jgi:hypothetical protein
MLDKKFQEGRARPEITESSLAGAILLSNKPTIPSLCLVTQSLTVFCLLGELSPHIFQVPIFIMIIDY